MVTLYLHAYRHGSAKAGPLPRRMLISTKLREEASPRPRLSSFAGMAACLACMRWRPLLDWGLMELLE